MSSSPSSSSSSSLHSTIHPSIHSLIPSIQLFMHPMHSHFDSSLFLLSGLLAQDNKARLPRITGLVPTNYFNMTASYTDMSQVEAEEIAHRLVRDKRLQEAVLFWIKVQSAQESGRNESEQQSGEPTPIGETTKGTKKRNRSGGLKRSRRIRLLRIQCEDPDSLPSDEALLAKSRKTRSKATRKTKKASSLR